MPLWKSSTNQHPLSILVFLAAAMTAGNPVTSATSQQRHAEVLIDSLLGVSAFDSVLTLMPSLLADADASNDSALTTRLLAMKGRSERR